MSNCLNGYDLTAFLTVKGASINQNQLHMIPSISQVIYQGLKTIVKWSDGTVTIVNCADEDNFDKEVGFAMAITRKYFESSASPRADFKHYISEAKVYN